MMKAAFTTAAVAALLTVPMAAQTVTQPPRAPITKGVTTGDLATQVDQARQQSADLLVQVSRLEGQISSLTGRIEVLEYDLGRARQSNNDLLTDNETLSRDAEAMREQLDRQARAITALQLLLGVEPEPASDSYTDAGGPQGFAMAAPPSNGRGIDSSAGSPANASGLPEGSLGTLPASQLPGEAGPLFTEAKSRLLRLDYAGAEEAFQSFIDQFGGAPETAEAMFWLGEALHQQGAWAESGQAYTSMIRSYPNDTRAPDAFVRLARSMRLVGDPEKACKALDTLPERYPDASKVVRDLAAVERTKSGCKV